MKTKPRSTIAVLLLGAFLLAWAVTANAARQIEIRNALFTLSSLNDPLLTADDTITIYEDGILWVDTNAVIKDLVIGYAGTKGSVLFAANPSSLTVANDVVFGGAPASGDNTLDMAYITPFTAHTLTVGRNFLRSGAGKFKAGSATIVYAGTANQNVTAKIGLSGDTIQYKDVVLKGIPVTGNAIKTFDSGVSINGLLDIQEKAQATGGSVTYGNLAKLQYNNGSEVTASTAEWPASTSVQVTITNGTILTLDADRTLGPNTAYGNVLVLTTGTTLKDGGKTLTVIGGISNEGGIQGAGFLKLDGTTSGSTLTGAGAYGNVILKNANGATLTSSAVSPSLIRGRLEILSGSGKLTLPNGTSHHVSLLTIGGADKAAGAYSAATDPTVFAGAGVLNVDAKPIPSLSPIGGAPTVYYGDPEVTISGKITPPTSPIDVAAFGNGAKDGEKVTIVVNSAVPVTNVADVVGGTFTTKFNTAGLGVGSSLGVFFSYAGGINLAGVPMNYPSTPNTYLTVEKRTITVVPSNATKTYGNDDPVFDYVSLPPPPNGLVGTDKFVGALSRDGIGTDAKLSPVGSYPINIGTLTITNDSGSWAWTNYTVVFDNTKRLTVTQKSLEVYIVSTNKTYGEANPYFTNYTVPAMVGTDKISGDAACTATTTTQVSQGPVAITRGGLTAGPNYAAHYNNGNLSILPKPITVTFATTITKTYGDADPKNGTLPVGSGLTNGMTVLPGLVGTDKIIGVPTRVTGETVAGSPYAITGGMQFTPANGNYTVTYVPGALTINARVVTVSAGDNIGTRKYGDNVVAYVKYSNFPGSGNGAGVPAQTVPTTKAATVVWGANGEPAKCGTQGLPNTYSYTIKPDAADPNCTFTPATDISANYIIGPAPLTVQAQNKTKVFDGNLFPYSDYTPAYLTFVCGDTADTALTGFLTYGGPAITAVDPGVYAIVPAGKSTLQNKYAVTHAQGYLAITASPGKKESDTLAWEPGASASWMINDPNGAAGGDPGWTLYKVTGTLQINATTANKFRLDLVTLVGGQAGRMLKFDPTRPYTWNLAEAGSISGFAANKFTINYDGSANGGYLFANPVFGGTFSLRQGLSPDNNKLYLDFTPVGATRDAAGVVSTTAPNAPDISDSYDVAPLLGDVVTGADLDTVYLSPNKTSVSPNDTDEVVINLMVTNLNQKIVGVNGYIKYSSTEFTFKKMEAGGGVWTSLIYYTNRTSGEFDVVVAVNITASAGTSDPGVVGKLTLAPTRTSTGKSRVIFRADGTGTVADNLSGTGVLTYLQPAVAGGAKILPARVMTPLITVVNDTAVPTFGTISATQTQPSWTGAGLTTVDVKGGSLSTRKQAIRTDSTYGSSGKVLITVNAADAGVGLSGPPTVTMDHSGSLPDVPLSCTEPTKTTQPFYYEWTIGAGDSGDWTARIRATDRKGQYKDTTFAVSVNTKEIMGIVELEGFLGASRTVNFKANGTISGSAAVRAWDPTLTFTSGYLMQAGAFQDTSGMAGKIAAATDTVSKYLAYGDILNLTALRDSLLAAQGTYPFNSMSAWVDYQLYGYIVDLTACAGALYTPTRSIDSYIVSKLSPLTVNLIDQYMNADAAGKAAKAQLLRVALLNDFNTIILDGNLYKTGDVNNPVRFASVTLNSDTIAALGGTDVKLINRLLLRDTFAGYYGQYIPGQLSADTAKALTENSAGLLGMLLEAFDTICTTSSMWPTPTSIYGPCLYNEQIFLGVTLSSTTVGLLTESPFPDGTRRTLLNQSLLQDAYPGIFVKAPLTPATVYVARHYTTASVFEAGMYTDLNNLIGGSSCIYTAARFPSIGVPFDTSTDLGALLQKNATTGLTSAERIRANRLLLESAYSEMSKGVLALYRLAQLPDNPVYVSGTTLQSLRVRQGFTLDSSQQATVLFIGNGVPKWQTGADFYLRGGDLAKDGDNQVNLADFFVLSQNWLTTVGGVADVDGDGKVFGPDYNLLLGNWGMYGDPEVPTP